MSSAYEQGGQTTNGKAEGPKANGRTFVPRVLFADDSDDILELLSFTAQRRGWQVDTAHNTDEILNLVSHQCDNGGRCYDVLVLDITFDAGTAPSGVQAVRAIRRRYRNIPVIFITGWTSRLVKSEAERVGQEVIAKPFDPNFVLDRAEIWMTWAGKFKAHEYEGPERRKASINRSGHYRRVTDKPVTVNERVAAVLGGPESLDPSVSAAKAD